METPVPNKTPRRKLKRVMVKSKLSQKRLKTAINVSLNSSHTLRSLRMNNRSLAHRLEGLKKEYRGAYEAYQKIQEENHFLRQKIVSLECVINDPDSYIEEQVNKKLEGHTEQVKNIIQQLHEKVLGLSLNLKSLDEVCSSYGNLVVDRSKRSDSLNGVLSRRLPSFHLPSPFGLQNEMNVDNHCADDTMANDETNTTSSDLDSKIADEGNNLTTIEIPMCDNAQENMSMILEQSAVVDIGSPLKPNEEKKSRQMSKDHEHITKLPRRMVTRSKERKDVTVEKEKADSTRRKTCTLSDDDVNVIGILDVEPPANLLLSPQLACSVGNNRDQDSHIGNSQNQNNLPVTGHLSEKRKKPPHLKEKHSKFQKKAPKIQSKAGVGPTKANDALYISNEFALINAHQQITEKLNAMQTESTEAHEDVTNRDYVDGDDHTVHIVEDMELTMPINVDIISGISNASESHKSNIKEELSSASNSGEHCDGDGEEVCPEAVTLQRMKPGQFKFAASRKETDGSRKSLLSQPPRARSKSKKAIAEMIENLPQAEPKSIFDFHDKTPTSISGDSNGMSVYSMRDESSIMSPPTPLGRRCKSQLMNKEKEKTESSVDERENFVESKISTFDEGASYSVPLKDDSHNNEKGLRGNLRGQSQNQTGNGRSKSRTRWSSEGQSNHVLDEGLTYGEPPRDYSHSNDMVTEGESQGRSRSKVKPNLSEDEPTNILQCMAQNEMVTVRKSRSKSQHRMERTTVQSNDFADEQASAVSDVCEKGNEFNKHPDKISTLGDGMTYSIPLKDDSDNGEKVTARKSRGRSRTRTKTAVEEPQCEEHPSVNSMVSALGEGETYSVPLKDESNKNEKVGARKSRGRSRTRTKTTGEELQRCEEQSNVNSKVSVSGEGETYSVPLKDEFNESEKAGARKSRGRSRTRTNTAVEESQRGEEQSNVNSKISVLGEGETYSVPLKDESNKSEKAEARKSRGRSRTRAKSAVEESQRGEEQSSVNSKVSVLGEGETYSVPLKGDSDKREKITVRKSRGRSRTRTNTAVEEPQCEEQSNVNSKVSVLGEGETYSVPLKDESNKSEKDEARKSRGRSHTRAKSAVEESQRGEEQSNVNSKISVLGEGETYSVPLKDESNKSEKDEARKSRGRSHNRAKSAVEESQRDEEQSSVNSKVSVLGEGETYSVPLKGDSDRREKITVRKSRGRSRTRTNTAVEEPQCEEHPSVNSMVSALGEGETYSVPLKDESNKNEKVGARKSRGRSRTRTKTTGEELQRCEEQSNVNSKVSVSGEGETYSVPLKDESNKSEKDEARKSRGRSRTRTNTAVEESQRGEEQSNVNSKVSVLGEGETYSVPLKDESNKSEKDEARKSRGRSRTRAKSAVEESQRDEEQSSVNSKVSVLGEGETYSIPLKDESNESKTAEARKPRGRSRNRTKTAEEPQRGEETYNNPLKDNNTDTTETEKGRVNKCRSRMKDSCQELSADNDQNFLFKGQDYSDSLQDDVHDGEMITLRKSRTNEGKNIDLNGRTRSPSQRHRNISTEVLSNHMEQISDEQGLQSEIKDKNEEINNCKQPIVPIVERSGHEDKIVLPISKDLSLQNKNSQKMRESRGSDNTEQDIAKDSHKKILNTDSSVKTSEAKSIKQKCPPKSHKNVRETKKRIKRCGAEADDFMSPLATKNRETLRPEHCSQKFSEMVEAHMLDDFSSSPKVNMNTTVKLSETVHPSTMHVDKGSKEKSLKRSCDIAEDAVADIVPKFSRVAAGPMRKESKSTIGELTCNNQEEFQSQLMSLKNLYTPDSFKTQMLSPSSTSSASTKTGDKSISFVKHSLSNPHLTTSASVETNSQQSCEPARRRRAAVKAVSYAEPSLGGKLRRGDPFTSMGPGAMAIYKSPKALKKTKVKRDVLGPLEDNLVEEEN